MGWIGVDLDGTLAEYDGWQGPENIGPPIIPMLERVKAWIAEGITVKIVTARVSGDPIEADVARMFIDFWLDEQGLPELEVTHMKDYGMWQLWDDRCVTVEKNTGRILTEGIE